MMGAHTTVLRLTGWNSAIYLSLWCIYQETGENQQFSGTGWILHNTKLSPIFWVKRTIHPKTGLFSPGLGFTVLIHNLCCTFFLYQSSTYIMIISSPAHSSEPAVLITMVCTLLYAFWPFCVPAVFWSLSCWMEVTSVDPWLKFRSEMAATRRHVATSHSCAATTALVQ